MYYMAHCPKALTRVCKSLPDLTVFVVNMLVSQRMTRITQEPRGNNALEIMWNFSPVASLNQLAVDQGIGPASSMDIDLACIRTACSSVASWQLQAEATSSKTLNVGYSAIAEQRVSRPTAATGIFTLLSSHSRQFKLYLTTRPLDWSTEA